MKKVQKFEDLIAWQKARALTRVLYKLTRDRAFVKDAGLVCQIQRAAVSIMANIAEGFERNRATEFHQFLSIAKGSCAEVRSHLYAAHDAGYLDKPSFDDTLAHAEELARIIGGLRASVENQKRPISRRLESSSTQDSAPSTQH